MEFWRRTGFFTAPTATFRILFVLVVLSHDRRRLVHFNVTEHPTAGWTARQLVEACGLEETPGHLIRDRDQVYGERFSRQARALNFREAVIAPRSPWQNAYAERVIGSIRPECLDHVVVIGERHLKRLLLEGTGWRIRPTMRLPLLLAAYVSFRLVTSGAGILRLKRSLGLRVRKRDGAQMICAGRNLPESRGAQLQKPLICMDHVSGMRFALPRYRRP